MKCNVLNLYRPDSNLKPIPKIIKRVVAFLLNNYLFSNNLNELRQSTHKGGNNDETTLVIQKSK